MTTSNDSVTSTFHRFIQSKKSGGIVLIVCTLVSLGIANSQWAPEYFAFWHLTLGGLSFEHWINDGLMAVFFLLIGLELERELYNGELAHFKKALLPVVAALGGIVCPALIHFVLNAGLPTQAGMGIPMATDIAFALGILALLGNRVPTSLKIFLTALAAIDDLGAIIVIAIFYTEQLVLPYLAAALGIIIALVICNRNLRIMAITPYLIGGAALWFCLLKSGLHATIAGVVLAFIIPFSAKKDDEASPSHRLENILHTPVAFIILPLFALANTGLILGANWADDLRSTNSLGIIGGLLLGKPIGIVLASVIAVRLGFCKLPEDLQWQHIIGAGCLGGIGFTMSIFITNLAFADNPELINSAKIAVLMASLSAGIIGFVWLRFKT